MDRIAVFVDAGYLFAQGSAALKGAKVRRDLLTLDAPEIVAILKAQAAAVAPDCSLLRIYWYDGALGGSRPTADQATLASLDDVKLRLGFINSYGQQKGVDSLIVTDLIELARLKSISDALLVSGDEDVRIGVQIAQNYGIRVHLLGIEPARASQSQQLRHEADTTREWPSATVAMFLSVREEPPPPIAAAPPTVSPDETIRREVAAFVVALAPDDLAALDIYWKTQRGVPPDMDRQILGRCRTALDAQLEREQIKTMRRAFQESATARIGHRGLGGQPA